MIIKSYLHVPSDELLLVMLYLTSPQMHHTPKGNAGGSLEKYNCLKTALMPS